jgi:hypothetical protein
VIVEITHKSGRAPLMALKPSIIVLTEYVVKDGDQQHADLCDCLETAGFNYKLSDAITGNRVLIASNMQMHRGSTAAPPSIPFAAANYLHVNMPTLDIVGLRVPFFDNSKTWKDAKSAYDQWFETNIKLLLALDKPLIAIGPLSYINPERLDDSYNATLFRDVIDAGWLISDCPKEQSSWWPEKKASHTPDETPLKPSRLDFALVSPHHKILSANYAESAGGYRLGGWRTPERLSDHAALVLDFELK